MSFGLNNMEQFDAKEYMYIESLWAMLLLRSAFPVHGTCYF